MLELSRGSHGRSVLLDFVDGSPTGLVTAEIINWTGKLLSCPRTDLSDLLGRAELNSAGVYLLTGLDPEKPTDTRVYIGETENFRARLRRHVRDEAKQFWQRVCVVVSKDLNLTKAHTRYLETRLYEIARAAGRSSIDNDQPPAPGNLPESALADMEFFLEQLRFVLPALGIDAFQPILAPPKPSPTGKPIAAEVFVLNTVGVTARAIETAGEFVVLKGSTARLHGPEAWGYRKLRNQLLTEGKLRKTGDNVLDFVEDVPFASPSAAAAVVHGGNINGRAAWNLSSTGQSYGDWQDVKLRPTDIESDDELASQEASEEA